MASMWKAAAVAFALGSATMTSGCAQAYDERYYGGDPGYYGAGPYDGAYYGTDAYGYCDSYGCPTDYWNLPIYYGPVFYNDVWFNGPLYYRDWGGRRQYWIHGGWRYDGWRGARPSWYREGRYGPALGLNWYRTNRVYRQGWNGGIQRRDRVYRAPLQAPPNRFSTSPENRFQDRGNTRSYPGEGRTDFGYRPPRGQDRTGNRSDGRPRGRFERPGAAGGDRDGAAANRFSQPRPSQFQPRDSGRNWTGARDGSARDGGGRGGGGRGGGGRGGGDRGGGDWRR